MGETSTYFLADGERTGGAFALVDERAKRGDSVPLHRHDEDMESFYVLEGEVTLFIGDAPGVRAGAGSFAHVPGGTVHGFRDRVGDGALPDPDDAAARRVLPSDHAAGAAGRLTAGDADRGSSDQAGVTEYEIEFIGPLPDRGLSDETACRPGGRRSARSGGVRQLLAAALPQLGLPLRVEPGRVGAGGPDAERERLPPVLEGRVLDAHRERGLLDLAQPGRLEQLGQVALRGRPRAATRPRRRRRARAPRPRTGSAEPVRRRDPRRRPRRRRRARHPCHLAQPVRPDRP